jgi:hypothetical protein
MGSQLPIFEYFFDLPPELRERILQELCICPHQVFLVNSPKAHYPGRSTGGNSIRNAAPLIQDIKPVRNCSLPLNLFLVNSQLYQEASAIFYSQNRFHGLCWARRTDADPSLVGRKSGLITSEAARSARMRIRRLMLTISRCGGFFEKEICRNVSDMILHGSLRDLTINLMAELPRPGEALNRPFRALYRLLADPDLEKATLNVHYDSAVVGASTINGWSWELKETNRLMAGCEEEQPGLLQVGDSFDTVQFKMLEVNLEELLGSYKDEDEALRIRRVGDEGMQLWRRPATNTPDFGRRIRFHVTGAPYIS